MRAGRWLLAAVCLSGCATAGPAATPPMTAEPGTVTPATPEGGPADAGAPRTEITARPTPEAPPAPPPAASVVPPGPVGDSPGAGSAATRSRASIGAPLPPPASEARVRPAPPEASATPARPTSPATAARPASPARPVVLNFDNADVELVVQAAAEIVGFNYVLAPGVRGRKVTVQTVGRIASDDVLAVLLTILEVNGLAAVRSGDLYRIIPREQASQAPVRTVVGRAVNPELPADEVITQIVALRVLGAPDAVGLLRPFVSSAGALAAHRESNRLLVTYTAANVRRLLEVLDLVDVEVPLSELQIFTLKHADAQELASLLGQIFASGPSGAGPAIPGTAGVASPPGPPAPPPGAAPPAAGAGSERPLIVPERRSNSLVVRARTHEVETIRRLIETLDVDLYSGRRVFMYFAENTRARDLVTTLDAIYGRGDRGPAITGTQHVAPGATGLVGPGGALPARQPPSLPSPPGVAPSAVARPAGGPAAFPGLAGDGARAGADIRFVADEVTNAIVVTTHPRLWKEIQETARRLDKMPRQVLIEVLAAEVTLSDDTRLGLEWAIRSGRFDASASPSGALPGRPPRSLIPRGGTVPLGFNVFTFAADRLLAALNALASDNRVNVLSNPSIMTAENRKAVINVSTSVPIVTSQQVPVATGGITGNAITQTVEYRDAGIILTVTPRIGEQGTVALDVRQEVNEVGENEPPPINSPRFTKREAETSVVLLDNQTLVLGGLIQSKRTEIRTGIPLLSRIPILGYLFGSVEHRVEKTELLLLITPRTVGTAVDAARVTERMRGLTRGLEPSIRQWPPPVAPSPTVPSPPAPGSP